ncbi:hypothetical protein TNCV_2003171 [Trichonephila clavipes]|nr:hypothetical protein TNCV_2003171 [Trichonephila clavipes]
MNLLSQITNDSGKSQANHAHSKEYSEKGALGGGEATNTKGQRQTPKFWARPKRAWQPPLGKHEKAAWAKKRRGRGGKKTLATH